MSSQATQEGSEGRMAPGEREGTPRRRRRKRGGGRRLLARGAAAPRASGIDDALEALQAEIMLLREENARLKTMEHQPADLGQALARLRALSARRGERESVADDAAAVLADDMVVRETLLVVCEEVERVMGALRGRLDAVRPLAHAPRPEATEERAQSTLAVEGNGSAPANGSADGVIRLIAPNGRSATEPEDAR